MIFSWNFSPSKYGTAPLTEKWKKKLYLYIPVQWVYYRCSIMFTTNCDVTHLKHNFFLYFGHQPHADGKLFLQKSIVSNRQIMLDCVLMRTFDPWCWLRVSSKLFYMPCASNALYVSIFCEKNSTKSQPYVKFVLITRMWGDKKTESLVYNRYFSTFWLLMPSSGELNIFFVQLSWWKHESKKSEK